MTTAFDVHAVRDLLKGPEAGRQWVSYGIVDQETDDKKSTTFDPDMGPLIDVKLQPSGAHARCRVASWCAGNGEAEHFPFVQGDEVCVLVMEGDESAGCVIVGRLNNQIDAFPTTVAGNDVTKNNFAFRRHKTPYVIETSAAWGVRNAVTGALLMMQQDGTFTLKDGHNNFLHLGPDFVGLQGTDDPDSTSPAVTPGASVYTLQFNYRDKNVRVGVEGKTLLLLSGAVGVPTVLASNVPVQVAASGALPTEHVATVEGVVNIVHNVINAMGLAMVAVGLPPVSVVGAFLVDPAVSAFINVGLAAAGVPATGSIALFKGAIAGALAAKLPNPDGLKPSVGSPGFFAG